MKGFREVNILIDTETEKWITDRSKGSFRDTVAQIVKNWVAYMKTVEDTKNKETKEK